MINKKITKKFATIIFAISLVKVFLPGVGIADQSGQFSLKGFFQPTYVGSNLVRDAKVQAKPVTKGSDDKAVSGSLVGKDYSPDYNFGYKSGGGALGFAASNDISFELEAVSSSVIKPVNGQEVFWHLQNRAEDRREPLLVTLKNTPNQLYSAEIPIKYKNKGFSYLAVMANVMYEPEFVVKEKIKPYFGGGLGMARLKVES